MTTKGSFQGIPRGRLAVNCRQDPRPREYFTFEDSTELAADSATWLRPPASALSEAQGGQGDYMCILHPSLLRQ